MGYITHTNYRGEFRGEAGLVSGSFNGNYENGNASKLELNLDFGSQIPILNNRDCEEINLKLYGDFEIAEFCLFVEDMVKTVRSVYNIDAFDPVPKAIALSDVIF